MLDLSIIIPVYNTPQDALIRCFAAIAALQRLRWETVVVDDGSQEETSSFCKNYCEQNAGFRYVRKENGGVSSARNVGLKNASGRYVMFADADDCLLSEAITPAQFDTDADLIIFDTDVIQNGQRTTWKGLELPAGDVERSDVLRRLLSGHALNSPCAKLYKTAFLQSNALCFDETYVTGEDWLFCCNIVLLAEKMQYIPVPVYLYYRDGGNALRRLQRFPDKMIENLIGMYQKKLQILDAEFASASDQVQLRSAASAMAVENLFNCTADLYLLKLQTPERKARIRKICRQANDCLLPNAPKKTRMKGWLLNHLWAGIYPMAHLRSVYLKGKKKNLW